MLGPLTPDFITVDSAENSDVARMKRRAFDREIDVTGWWQLLPGVPEDQEIGAWACFDHEDAYENTMTDLGHGHWRMGVRDVIVAKMLGVVTYDAHDATYYTRDQVVAMSSEDEVRRLEEVATGYIK